MKNYLIIGVCLVFLVGCGSTYQELRKDGTNVSARNVMVKTTTTTDKEGKVTVTQSVVPKQSYQLWERVFGGLFDTVDKVAVPVVGTVLGK